MSTTDHFPKLNIRTYKKKLTLDGRETPEEFLARGGSINKIPTGVSSFKEGGKLSAKENRERVRNIDVQRALQLGTLNKQYK